MLYSFGINEPPSRRWSLSSEGGINNDIFIPPSLLHLLVPPRVIHITPVNTTATTQAPHFKIKPGPSQIMMMDDQPLVGWRVYSTPFTKLGCEIEAAPTRLLHRRQIRWETHIPLEHLTHFTNDGDPPYESHRNSTILLPGRHRLPISHSSR